MAAAPNVGGGWSLKGIMKRVTVVQLSISDAAGGSLCDEVLTCEFLF